MKKKKFNEITDLIMPYMDKKSYCEIPFYLDTPCNDFYTYIDLKDVPEKCESHMNDIVRCRTIGILQSLNGRFYLTHFNSTGAESMPLVQVSVVYLQSPPHSTVFPYPVQIFGTLQWKNRPVIYAKILQAMNPSTALRLKNALCCVTSTHLAKIPIVQEENDEI